MFNRTREASEGAARKAGIAASAAEPNIPRDLRLACVVSASTCALPMLVHLPALLGVMLLAGFGIGLLSQRRWPAWLRALLTVTLVGAVMTGFSFKLGRDTASALLVAMLALKTLELGSHRDGRSLVGFALFAPFAGFLQDQGPMTLLLALPALIAVVIALQRLAEPDPEATIERPAATGFALATRLKQSLATLIVAVPLALAGFWLFPRLAVPLWGMPDNAQSKTGLNDKMSPGDWLDVMTDDSPAFSVRFFGPAPPVSQMYWRGPVLSQFDGRSWTRAEWNSALPRAETAAEGEPLRYEITLEATDRRFLLALDLPDSVSVPASIGRELTVLANAPVRSVLRYRAQSSTARRFEAELSQAQRRAALALPAGFNPRTVALAQSWRSRGETDVEIMRRTLDWIQREFSYSLQTPLLGRNSIDEFLFDEKIGYCEHFSSAFVVLMRAAGIPARVVTGYAGGYRNRLGNFWLVRQSDAHAWAEVWQPERGWLRVDPTAAVAPERVFETLNQTNPGGALGMIRGAIDLGDWAHIGWNDLLLQFNAERQRALLKPLGIDDASALQLGLAFTVGAGLALLLTLALLLRGQRTRIDPVQRAWSRFQQRLARAGYAKLPAEPAQRYGERLAALLPEHAERLRSLSRRFADWRYAAEVGDEQQQRALIRDLHRFRCS